MEKKKANNLEILISFPAKIAKQGSNSRIITVPKEYWGTGIVDDNKIYQVTLREIGIRKLSEEKYLEDFLEFAKICPICKKENERKYLEDFYHSKDPKNVKLKKDILKMMQLSQKKGFETGVLCCDCFKKLGIDKDKGKDRIGILTT